MAYTRRVKEAAISMMLPPSNQSLAQISERTQIPESTLKKWRGLAVSGTFSARTQSEAGNAVGERVFGHGKSLCRLRTRLQFGKNGTNSSALD